MKKLARKFLPVAIMFVLAFCLTACGGSSENESGSTSRTQELFSKYTKETGVHMGLSMENDGKNVSVDLYQLGDNMYIDTISGEDHIIFLVKDDILTVLDPVNMVYEQMEITDEVEMQLETITSGVENILSLGQTDTAYEKGTVKIDGMNYETEEAGNDEATAKFVYNDDGDLVYMIKAEGDTETRMKITAFDGNVEESRFDIPEGYAAASEGSSTDSDTTTEATTDRSTTEGSSDSSNTLGSSEQEVINEEGGYSFQTADYNTVSKSGNITMVYTNSQEAIPYFSVIIYCLSYCFMIY